MQRNSLYLMIVVLIIALTAILIVIYPGIRFPGNDEVTNRSIGPSYDAEGSTESWNSIYLRDVSTSRIFQVRDLSGKPVLLFSFTTWCSICTAQQVEITKLQNMYPGSFIAVGIDIDPYEQEDIVRKHQADNRFYGLYTVAPQDLTNDLVNDFGVGIITPASAPVLLICSNGSVTKLPQGIKSAEALGQAIRMQC